MSSFLLIVSLIIYSIQYKKCRKEIRDLQEKINCIVDQEFWDDEICEEKI